MSAYNKLKALLPDDVRDKRDVLLWLLENGVYVHKDDELPLNDLCNHQDSLIAERGDRHTHAPPASVFWYNQAANTKIFYLLAEARGIQNNHNFKIAKGKE